MPGFILCFGSRSRPKWSEEFIAQINGHPGDSVNKVYNDQDIFLEKDTFWCPLFLSWGQKLHLHSVWYFHCPIHSKAQRVPWRTFYVYFHGATTFCHSLYTYS